MSYQIELHNEVTKLNNDTVSQKHTEEKSDWHRADIVAALKKRRLSVRQLSRESGLKDDTLANALRSPWPKGEAIIAKALNVKPEEIWPSRYHYDHINN